MAKKKKKKKKITRRTDKGPPPMASKTRDIWVRLPSELVERIEFYAITNHYADRGHYNVSKVIREVLLEAFPEE